MSIRKLERTMENLEQLDVYVDSAHGKIAGRYWYLEDFDGGEFEHGAKGHYAKVQDPETGTDSIVFTSVPEIYPSLNIVITSEQEFALGAIQVYSRKQLVA